MIKLENTQITGWKPAIRGMRNPMNSWEKSDSYDCETQNCFTCPTHWSDRDVNGSCEYWSEGFNIGPNDHDLMLRLAKAGSVEGKFRRMIAVYVDITAPLYWWKEFDTYKVGTVANSCSTMHKIHAKEFTLNDFSFEHITDQEGYDVIDLTIKTLNFYRDQYLEVNEEFIKKNFPPTELDPTSPTVDELKRHAWWQMIQLLPSSYNQRRTVMLNYEVLSNIYRNRRNHKLDEWRKFCKWIEELPYSEIITCNAEPLREVKDLDESSIYPANYIAVNLANRRNIENNDLIK